MARGLAERIAGGFAVGDRWHSWGTLFGELRARYPQASSPDDRWLAVACDSLGSLAVVDADLHGPHPDRPVTAASYGLPAALADDDGLTALRDELDRQLGPGRHADVERLRGIPASGSVRATSDWRAGDVGVSLSAYATVRTSAFGPSGGRLYLRADEERLAAPYLAGFLAADQLWAQTAGTVRRFSTGGNNQRRPPDDAARASWALRYPHLHQTPAWVAAELGPGDCAVWSIERKFWGLADRFATIAVRRGAPVALDHERCARARGAGWSAVYWRDRGPVIGFAPGPALLDPVVEELRRRPGVEITTVELADA